MKPKYFIPTDCLNCDNPTIYAVYPQGYAHIDSYSWVPYINTIHISETNCLEVFERWECYHPVSVSQIRTWYPNFKQHKLIK